jgi:hypothetical protein
MSAAPLSKEERLALLKDALRAAHPASQCQFFLQRKMRFCKFDVRPGRIYCTNHGGLDGDPCKKRVRCPYNAMQCEPEPCAPNGILSQHTIMLARYASI